MNALLYRFTASLALVCITATPVLCDFMDELRVVALELKASIERRGTTPGACLEPGRASGLFPEQERLHPGLDTGLSPTQPGGSPDCRGTARRALGRGPS